MVSRRRAVAIGAILATAALLAYLHDPPWLISYTSGLRRWEQPAGMPRYRWSSGHASFFVPADAGAFDLPVSTTFDAPDDAPMMVTISVDGDTAARVVLTDGAWTRVRVTLPARGSRRVRRIDIRTNVTRADTRGVRVGAIEAVRTTALSRRRQTDVS